MTPAPQPTSSGHGGGDGLTPTSASRPVRPAASTWSTWTSTAPGPGSVPSSVRDGPDSSRGGRGWSALPPAASTPTSFAPPPHDQRSWQVPSQHIDFRGDGGYIIIPPSCARTDEGVDRHYQQIAVAEHHRPTPVDASGLRRLLDPPRPLRPSTAPPSIGRAPDKLAAWVASRPEGARNGGLFWAACRMAEDGHDLRSTTSLLGQAAHAAGLPEPEALTTIRSAFRIVSRVAPAPPSRPTRAVEGVGL